MVNSRKVASRRTPLDASRRTRRDEPRRAPLDGSRRIPLDEVSAAAMGARSGMLAAAAIYSQPWSRPEEMGNALDWVTSRVCCDLKRMLAALDRALALAEGGP